jgi:hypothetical protein|tara:strand:- start:34 stop:333 length:300 start_codon:yes stop_codon:yes gene_type:complete
MKEPQNTTTAVVDVNNISLSLKAREDTSEMNPSGWSIIAFAPSASIRCIRAHQPQHLDLFVRSIMALSGISSDTITSGGRLIHREITNAVHKITGSVFE